MFVGFLKVSPEKPPARIYLNVPDGCLYWCCDDGRDIPIPKITIRKVPECLLDRFHKAGHEPYTPVVEGPLIRVPPWYIVSAASHYDENASFAKLGPIS